MQEMQLVEIILPGFKFHPTDEELVGFYLQRKVQNKSLPFQIIPSCDIFNFDPWELTQTTVCGDNNTWYYFCPRDQKYKQSVRPNRVTKCGYWKATGPDRPIFSKDGVNCLGLKKSLVFYQGKAAKAMKTDWGLHEFRLPAIGNNMLQGSKNHGHQARASDESWSVCRIFRKRSPVRRPKSSEVNDDRNDRLDLSYVNSQERQEPEDSSDSERQAHQVEFFNFLENDALNQHPQLPSSSLHASLSL